MNVDIVCLISKAEEGDVEAQFLLGYIYQYGDNGEHLDSSQKEYQVEINYKQARKWYLLAAKQNHVCAQYNLANSCDDLGEIKKEEYCSKALYWYEKSAKLGDVRSQISTAEMYEKGKGCEQNIEKAIYWYKEATVNGWSYAKYKLAFYYINGGYLEQDLQTAIELYKQASHEGVDCAMYELARIYEIGDWIPQDLNKALELYLKSSKTLYIPSLLRLVKAYSLGELGLAIDQEKFIFYLEQAKRSEIVMDDASLEKKEDFC